MLLLCCLNCSALCFASVCGFCCSWDISWKRELWEYMALNNASAREVARAAGDERARGASSGPQRVSSSVRWSGLAKGNGTTTRPPPPNPTKHTVNNNMAREILRFLLLAGEQWQLCCAATAPTAQHLSSSNNGFIFSEAQEEDLGWSHAHLLGVPGLWSIYQVDAGAAFLRS